MASAAEPRSNVLCVTLKITAYGELMSSSVFRFPAQTPVTVFFKLEDNKMDLRRGGNLC